jgi:DNA-binding response OmpR family regulator
VIAYVPGANDIINGCEKSRITYQPEPEMNRKILVVDDEPSIRNLLEKAFTAAGYETVLAGSGEEAKEILDDQNIQVMFLDMSLPGISGLELCNYIRNKNPIACLCAITGYGSVFELAECRDAGFDDYFLKPLDVKALIQTAEDSFRRLERWRSNGK